MNYQVGQTIRSRCRRLGRRNAAEVSAAFCKRLRERGNQPNPAALADPLLPHKPHPEARSVRSACPPTRTGAGPRALLEIRQYE